MRRSRVTLIEVLVWTMLAGIVLFMLVAWAWERLSCKNGEEVRDGDGSMDCTGTEFYKHCEPSTHFVCHDED